MSDHGKKKKVYVLDTNVLMNNKYAIQILSGNEIPDEEARSEFEKKLTLGDYCWSSEPNDIVIVDMLERELDHLKKDPKKLNYKDILAKEAINSLDELRETYKLVQENILLKSKSNSLNFFSKLFSKKTKSPNNISNLNQFQYGLNRAFIELENGAKVNFQEHKEWIFQKLNIPFANNDDRFIYHIKCLMKEHPENHYIFVSSDINARNRAKTCGISAEDFEFQNVKNPNQLYKGFSTHSINDPAYENYLPFIKNLKEFYVMNDVAENIFGKLPKHNQTLIFKDLNSEKQVDENDSTIYFIAKKEDEKFIIKPSLGHKKLENLIEEHNASSGVLLGSLYEGNKSNFNSVKDNMEKKLEKLFDEDKISKKSFTKKLKQIRGFTVGSVENISIMNQFINSISKSETGEVLSDDIRSLNVILNKNIKPLYEQIPYVNLLMDKNIPVVSASGPAGTGKTYFALLCGMMQYLQGDYSRVRYIKPLVSSDEGHGFLRGSLEEKMAPWIRSAKDNLLCSFCYDDDFSSRAYDKHVEKVLKDLETDKILEYESLTFDAGRTWRNKYVVVDEVQLLTLNQIALILGRIGEGTKAVLVGDLGQIALKGRGYDYLTERNSGLAHMVEKLPDEKTYAHIALSDNCIKRSEAAKLANRLH